MDLREILKIGDRLYSPICGKCELIEIHDDYLKVRVSDDNKIRLFKLNGCYYDSIECLLFPSKECRTWDNLNELIIRSPEKGKYVISTDDRIFICDGTEYIDNGKRYSGSICYQWFDKEGILIPKSIQHKYIIPHRYANKKEIDEFNKELNINGFSFNSETCTLNKVKPRVNERDIYYYINPWLDINKTMDCYSDTDNKQYKIGNYFITKEEAIKVRDKLKKLIDEKLV